MEEIDLNEEMEMPTLCECGEWFDLNDGDAKDYGDTERERNTIVCPKCGDKYEKLSELEDEIEEHELSISDAEYDLKYHKPLLEEKKKKRDELLNS